MASSSHGFENHFETFFYQAWISQQQNKYSALLNNCRYLMQVVS